jgi:hypothetical protein
VFRIVLAATLFVVGVHPQFSFAQTAGQATPPAATEAVEKIDYSKGESWLCRPGRSDDACAIDMTTTVVAPDGTLTRETWTANPQAAIDCFYVYPTVSRDQTPNSDMTAGDEERNAVRQQFARFASQCRPFAPLYRQVTLRALLGSLSGGSTPVLDRGLAYDDVLAAWNYYVKNDNNGRGVVLVGHSQGSYLLTRLIASEIDGKPFQSRLVSAMLVGATVPVAKGKGVGGAFKNIPLCRSADQIGCLIAFATFRSTAPPPANTLFGRVTQEGLEAACTNPAALDGGSGVLHAYLIGAGGAIASTAPQKHQWTSGSAVIETPFVSVPGLLSARCASNEHANYLEITVTADPNDARADDIPGGSSAPALAVWGMHVHDLNLTMGNLVDIVGKQAKAYLARSKK